MERLKSCDLLYHLSPTEFCRKYYSCLFNVVFSKEIGHHLLDIVNEIIPFALTKDNRSKKVSQLKKVVRDKPSWLYIEKPTENIKLEISRIRCA